MQASLQLLSNRKRDLLPGQRENDGQREQDDVIQQDRVSTGLALNTHSSVEALRVLSEKRWYNFVTLHSESDPNLV